MAIFPEKTRVGQYAVQRLIKENAVNASYLVTDDSGKSFFMKVFDMGSYLYAGEWRSAFPGGGPSCDLFVPGGVERSVLS